MKKSDEIEPRKDMELGEEEKKIKETNFFKRICHSDPFLL